MPKKATKRDKATKSQRLNTRYAFVGPYNDEPVQITNDQFEALEKAGCKEFNDALRKEIKQALHFFTIDRDQEKNAFTRKHEWEQLERVASALKVLDDFFYDAETHDADHERAADGVRESLYNALIFPTRNEDGDVVYEAWRDSIVDRSSGLQDTEIKSGIERPVTEPVLDMDQFRTSIGWMRIACTRAAKKLNDDIASDKGGPQQDKAWFNLLYNLNRIYGSAPGRTRGRDRFVSETLKLIREDIRPHPYRTDDALKKAINKAMRLYSIDGKKKIGPRRNNAP